MTDSEPATFRTRDDEQGPIGDLGRPLYEPVWRTDASENTSRPHRLARLGGRLVGMRTTDGRAWVGVQLGQGDIVPVVWPRDLLARFEPFELVDTTTGAVVQGGAGIVLGGGFLPPVRHTHAVPTDCSMPAAF